MEYLSTFIMLLAPRIPLLLVFLAGLIVAIRRRDRHPHISRLAGIFFGGSLLMSIVGSFLSLWPLFATRTFDIPMARIGIISSVIVFFTVLIDAALIVVVIYAIFGERGVSKGESE